MTIWQYKQSRSGDEKMGVATAPAPSTPARANIATGFDASIALEDDWTYTSVAPQVEEETHSNRQHVVLANTIMPTNNEWEER